MSRAASTIHSSTWDNVRPTGTDSFPGARWHEPSFAWPLGESTRQGATSGGIGRPARADLRDEIEVSEFVDEPVEVSPTATKQARFVALQKWEGRVTECLDDGFRAVLTDITTAGIEERVEFDLDEVSRDDLPLIVPGAVFYWSVGYRDEPTGERSRSSIIKFRRLPGWSVRDLERITDRVTGMKKRLGLLT